jgi:hypothetical protein
MIIANDRSRYHIGKTTSEVARSREDGESLSFKCQYQANVVKIFEIVSNKIVCMIGFSFSL